MRIFIILNLRKSLLIDYTNKKIPNILTIAGFDPSAGAGVLADIKTIGALRAHGCAALTCLTIQNTQGVSRSDHLTAEFVSKQISTILSDISVEAIKIGVAANKTIIDAIAEQISKYPKIPIVLDTVFSVSANEFQFLDKLALDALTNQLLPLANIITPNLDEAAILMKKNKPKDVTEMISMAKDIHRDLGFVAGQLVYLKGGHLDDKISPDVIFDGTDIVELSTEKIDRKNTRGTGCTLSAAIAALIPQTESLLDACCGAKKYVTQAISKSTDQCFGKGRGSLNHFYNFFN